MVFHVPPANGSRAAPAGGARATGIARRVAESRGRDNGRGTGRRGDEDDARVRWIFDGTIALFVLNGKERLSATTTTTTKEKIQCSWFKRRKRKANAFDYSTLGRDGNDDDDDDDDDDEELEEDQEKDECVGVDCMRMTKLFIVRGASGSGYQRASIDVLDARSGKSVISLRLPTCWPPECASFEVKCEEFEKGQIIVAGDELSNGQGSYENVVGCERVCGVSSV